MKSKWLLGLGIFGVGVLLVFAGSMLYLIGTAHPDAIVSMFCFPQGANDTSGGPCFMDYRIGIPLFLAGTVSLFTALAFAGIREESGSTK